MPRSNIQNLTSAIVGAGISGLSAAYYLSKKGLPVTLIEKRPRLGGVIETERCEGCLIEGGPDSFLSAKPWALELISELGLSSEVIGSNDHLRKTFIRRRGRMIPMPEGLQFLIPTRLAPIATTPLLSPSTKVGMALEYFRKPPRSPRPDISVAEFVRDHYGDEAVEYLAEPLLAGVYGGSPESLSVSSVLPRFVELEAQYGSLTRGVLAARSGQRNAAPSEPLFRTLKNGLGSLVDALASAIRGKVNLVQAEVEAIEPFESGYRLRVAGDWICAAHVVLACEAYVSARLSAKVDPALAELLAGVRYTSSNVVALGFDAAAFPQPPQGFGFLIPRRERKLIAACTFVGNKFPFRISENKFVLRCFIGGTIEQNDASLVYSVLEEIREMTGLQGDPLFSRVYRWPLSMAQYEIGHAARILAIEMRLRTLPGFHLAGNAYHGIGIPDCVRNGKQLADSIVK